MPTIPFNTPYMAQFGYKFDFVDAFTETATAQGIPINTSFSTLQTSLGASTDLFPAQQTAWGRANQGMVGLATLTTPNALGEVGTFNDTPSTNTSLWAYAKQAYINASGGNVPPASSALPGAGIVSDGSNWVVNGDRIKLGNYAGESNQSLFTVALGRDAGQVTQGALATAIGYSAGNSNQGTKSIAIGNEAGQNNQGVNAIAIGTLAGEDNQHDNTIVLNASGAGFNSAQPGGLYINPVRNVNGNSTIVTYNPYSGEVCFDTLLTASLGTSIDAPSLTSSVWAYAKYAEGVADTNLGTLNTQFTANGSNAVGTSADTASLTTSLWAYAKQAELDAQTGITNALRAAPYNLTGSTIAGVITNPKGTGSGNAWTPSTWYLVSEIVLNIPPNWTATDNVYFDGWFLYNFQAGAFLNTYWGVSYFTNTNPTPIDILGSTTQTQDSIYYPSASQQYIPVNVLIPPTNLTAGGTITLRVYGFCANTGTNYLSTAPVIAGRVGVALN